MWTLIANGYEHATFESLRKARLYAIRFFPNSICTIVEDPPQDKLEARLAAGRNDVTDDTTARYHQEVAAMRAAAAADRRRGYERTPY